MLDVGLKEWSVTCDLLQEGRLSLLLRKGGIHEAGGPGVFELEHDRFVLFPAWSHQRPEMLKAPYRERVVVHEHEPPEVTLEAMGEAAAIRVVPTREALDALGDLHPWSAAQLDMRWQYRPERPLYVVAVRVYRLAEATTIANDPSYAGCRSWVPLKPGDAVDEAAATPVLSDDEFGRVSERIDAAMGR
jgi:hypothetical protein